MNQKWRNLATLRKRGKQNMCSIETYKDGSIMTIENGVSMHSVTEIWEWLRAEEE